MKTITVTGEKQGKTTTVTFGLGKSITVKFNDETDFRAENELLYEIEQRHPIGGTYFPPKNSAEYCLAGCYYYFDKVVSVENDGVDFEEMESEPGRIY